MDLEYAGDRDDGGWFLTPTVEVSGKRSERSGRGSEVLLVPLLYRWHMKIYLSLPPSCCVWRDEDHTAARDVV